MKGGALQERPFYLPSSQVVISSFNFRKKKSSSAAVEGIYGQRVTEGLEVNPDLVGSACFDLHFQERKPFKQFPDPVKRQGFFSPVGDDHLTGPSRMRSDGLIDLAFLVREPATY